MIENNGIYQNNEWTTHENKEAGPVQPVQMNIYQSYSYITDLSWLHFYNCHRVQEGQ